MNKIRILDKRYRGTKPYIRKVKVGFVLITLIMALAFVGWAVKAVNHFFEHNYLQFNKVINIELKKPVEIKERVADTQQIVTILETIPAPEDLETEPEKLIFDYFGHEHYRMAIAVSKCEGLNHPADGFNTNTNGSIDVGYMRINSVHFKTEGCSLLDVATPEGNISCGYKVWDRADGTEGDGKGSFNPWVGYTNGCAMTKYE